MSLIEDYNRDGYVVVRKVIDPDLIKEASNHVEWLMKKNPGRRPEQLWQDLIPNDPFWVRLISDRRLLDVAQEFIGPDIALFASHYLCKPAGNGMPVLWHQDGSYWPLDPMNVVTLWLAVDDSTPENGCMRVIPGTQHLQLQQLKERKDVTNVLNSEIDASFVDESKAVDLVLRAGDLSVHHPNVIHGSNANPSPKRRCGLTIRYIPTRTRITVPWGCDFLLRGAAVPGINDYKPFPKYVGGESQMAFRDCEQWK
jgi:ectoine hydroxylase-related dioxygenase (phytanoyl-CoA dioxygenase family)